MIRSMYSGISGMKNFQTKLDVIGNNIANVNTYGFKKGRVTFKDMVNQTISGASGPTQGKGGVNPKQVGLGSQLAAIDTIDTQGSLQTTGRVFDLAIQGDGYLVVAEGRTGAGGSFTPTSTYYTRAGNLYLNNDGFLVTASGHYVLSADTTNSTLQPIQLNDGKIQEIKSLSISENGKISYIKTSSTSIADTKTAIEVVLEGLEKAKEANKGLDKAAADLVIATAMPAGTTPAEIAAKQAAIDKANTLASKSDADFKAAHQEIIKAIDAAEQQARVYEEESRNSILDVLNALPARVGGPPSLYNTANLTTEELAVVEAANDAIKVVHQLGQIKVIPALADPSNTTQKQNWVQLVDNASKTGLTAADTAIASFSAAEDVLAFIAGLDKEGDLLSLQLPIALARFANPGGLERVGENMYVGSASSGQASFLEPGTGGAGMLVSGALEMSNVDLSEEFTEMIVAQRGFQANTRIITTSDEILQELVNLKR